MMPVPVGVFVRGVDFGTGCPEAPLAYRLERHVAGKAQALNGLNDGTRIDSGVYQGAQGHVTGDTAEAIKITQPHALSPCPRDDKIAKLWPF
jgi:hypothetical protein